MSRVHTYILYLTTALILAYGVKTSLLNKFLEQSAPLKSGNSSVTDKLAASYEEKLLELQAKLSYASRAAFSGSVRGTQVFLPLGHAAENVLGETIESLAKRKNISFELLEKLTAASFSFDFKEQLPGLCRMLAEQRFQNESLPQTPLLRFCEKDSNTSLLNRNETEALSQRIGWFALLLASDFAAGELKEEAQKKAALESQEALSKASVVFVSGFLLLSASLFCSLVIGLLLLGKRFHAQFTPEGCAPEYALQVFCLYLSCMLLLPELVSLPGGSQETTPRLLTTAFCIFSLCLLLLVPCLQGVCFSDLRARIGLRLFSLPRFIEDTIVGPLAYLSSLCPLLLFLTLYSYLLVSLQIDPNAGTHPLVPFLISSEDKSEIWIIIILAVVIAPIVEEIMFRGALYSWMRVHFSPGFSIFCSSLIFAALHPQGLIGVFPLLIIGIVLALLREWRGNLISAIFAHACFNGATLLLLQAFR